MLNVLLSAGCTCRWSSDWAIKCYPCSYSLVVRADEALIGCNKMLNVFLFGWNFWCMAGVVVRADEALIGCNQMLNVKGTVSRDF